MFFWARMKEGDFSSQCLIFKGVKHISLIPAHTHTHTVCLSVLWCKFITLHFSVAFYEWHTLVFHCRIKQTLPVLLFYLSLRCFYHISLSLKLNFVSLKHLSACLENVDKKMWKNIHPSVWHRTCWHDGSIDDEK